MLDHNGDVIPGVYQHYKGKYYKVLGISQHTEKTKELVVVYIPLYPAPGYRLQHRPLKMFLGKVVYNRHRVSRFVYIGQQLPEGVGEE